MALRLFFVETLSQEMVELNEETSKHIINVLRMQKGDELLLTNGKGKKTKAVIVDDNRKKCICRVTAIEEEKQPAKKTAIGISLVKNTSRFEWFLEKATEIGITEIIPLICDRTEKEKFRHDRLQGILISAMLQSEQSWLPVLHEPMEFNKAILDDQYQQKFIAHCEPTNKKQLADLLNEQSTSQIILIGPEGDFTSKEIEAALKNNFIPVSLGETRLRTETAGLVSAVMLKLGV